MRKWRYQDYAERVFLFALQALPSDEAAVVGAHIAGCAECRQEMETLRPIVDSFVSGPVDLLRSSVPLWERLARRIAAETGGEPVLPASQRSVETERHRVSMLVRLAPVTQYPPTATPMSKSCICCRASR